MRRLLLPRYMYSRPDIVRIRTAVRTMKRCITTIITSIINHADTCIATMMTNEAMIIVVPILTTTLIILSRIDINISTTIHGRLMKLVVESEAQAQAAG